MNFFETYSERNQETSAYHEFQRGGLPSNNTYERNRKDSIFLHDDTMVETEFYLFLEKQFPQYEFLGAPISISKDEWVQTYEVSKDESCVIREIVDELNDWATDVFRTERRFSILGI